MTLFVYLFSGVRHSNRTFSLLCVKLLNEVASFQSTCSSASILEAWGNLSLERREGYSLKQVILNLLVFHLGESRWSSSIQYLKSENSSLWDSCHLPLHHPRPKGRSLTKDNDVFLELSVCLSFLSNHVVLKQPWILGRRVLICLVPLPIQGANHLHG